MQSARSPRETHAIYSFNGKNAHHTSLFEILVVRYANKYLTGTLPLPPFEDKEKSLQLRKVMLLYLYDL